MAKSVDWTVMVGLDARGDCVRFERWHGTGWDDTIRRIADTLGGKPALVDETGVGAPVVDCLRQAGAFVEGYTFTQQSKQALMGRLSVAVQRREVRFPDGVCRSELEAFEYQHTASGVRYSAPDGMHDDCVCALALARWKLDTFIRSQPVAEWVGVESAGPVASYDRMREDPDWGFDDA